MPDPAVTTPPSTMVGRAYLSGQHLWAARHFSRLATIEERANGSILGARHRAYVLNAITSSVSFLEAAINEMFQDVADHDDHPVLDSHTIGALRSFWRISNEGQRYLGVLDKYDLARTLARRSALDRGTGLWADVSTLVQLRNWIVHSKPEDFSDIAERSLAKRLRGRFTPNALTIGWNLPFFPDHALSAGCAMWAHETAFSYVEAFCRSMGLEVSLPEFMSEPDGPSGAWSAPEAAP